ncbi:hypothetical protein Zmor_018148 [Zophobas morio]|uniref:Uncharacterized protein n=1 Tax=Zophobas morio TaxID=2755281 RepID=A0AA38IB14_9CUCU|nr:hypothetical protein Zmor_018148 [Zophobas morio]
MTIYTAIRYKTILEELDWILSTLLDSTRVPNNNRSGRWPLFKPKLPFWMFRDRGLSGIPIATSASKLFFSERYPAAVIDDKSPINAVHTRTHRRRTGAAYGFLS